MPSASRDDDAVQDSSMIGTRWAPTTSAAGSRCGRRPSTRGTRGRSPSGQSCRPRGSPSRCTAAWRAAMPVNSRLRCRAGPKLSPSGELAEDAHPVGARLNHDQAQCDDRVEVGGAVSGEDTHGRVGSPLLAHAENNAIVPGCVEAQTQRTKPAPTQPVRLPEQRDSVLAALAHRLAANGK
jgi:hypothetical protein